MRKIRSLLSLLLSTLILVEICSGIVNQREGRKELSIDLDGNGRPDLIERIKYEKPKQLPLSVERNKCESRAGHFVKYLFYRDMRQPGVMIFDYFIGDAESEYWVYEIGDASDLNGDSLLDLTFYAGDDTTNEHVFLLQNPSSFTAVYTGVMGLDEYALSKANEIVADPLGKTPQVVAKWNPRREVFEGEQVRWAKGDCVSVQAEPKLQSKVLRQLIEGDIVGLIDESSGNDGGAWQKVKIEGIVGWVSGRDLSASSPIKQFVKK